MKENGRYGDFGGYYVPEVLIPALEEIEAAFYHFKEDPKFIAELESLRADYLGRETPLYFAKRFSEYVGYKVYLKREDLVHGGAHKGNNTLGQGLLARYMGKEKLIAETGAGQHGLATSMIGALLDFDTKIFMGAVDVARQSVNVHKMKLCGASVVPVSAGSGTLKDAINDAMRYWCSNLADTFYLFGTAAGPHPFPEIVRYFQTVIGIEARKQILAKEGKLPDMITACVGGGSNAIGLFSAFLEDSEVKIVGVEAGGRGVETGHHCATLSEGEVGVFHGAKGYLLQDEVGQVFESESISAGLDYPGVGPEHSHLKASGRAKYMPANDIEVLDAFETLIKTEGIIPALESSHALAYLISMKNKLPADTVVVANLSGRGDKDVGIVEEHRSVK